jgi:hypothetical protein
MVQQIAGEALEGKHTFENKIKPSSFRVLTENSGFETIKHLTDEFLGHRDANSEVHAGGGIREAVSSVLQIVGGWIGGERVNKWFAPHKKVEPIPDKSKMMARLLQGTYQDERPETIGNWTRIDDYDTNYGSIWKNRSNEYVLSVRGTKLKMRDIISDVKIAGGSYSQTDDTLTKTLREFHEEHPNSKLSIAAHSLGTQLAWNSIKDVSKMKGTEDIYFFNPASSPFADKAGVREIIDRPNTSLFLNTGDVVSNYFGQNMTSDEIARENVHYGTYAKSPLSAHGLSQWTSEAVDVY